MAKFQIRQAIVDWFCVTTMAQLTTTSHCLLSIFCARQSAGSWGAELSSPWFLPSGSLWSTVGGGAWTPVM